MLQDIGLVDPQLHKTLCKMQEALRQQANSMPVLIDGCVVCCALPACRLGSGGWSAIRVMQQGLLAAGTAFAPT